MSLFTDFISLIYPRSCICCSNLLLEEEKHVCNYCYITLPKANFHLDNTSELDKVFEGRIKTEKANSFLLFESKGKVQKLLHAIKYQNNKALAIQLGEWYGAVLKDNAEILKCEVIISVPLHAKKLQERGFNQSELFAQGLSKSLNIPSNTTSLVRTAYTSSQTKKTKAERWENVEDKFEVINAEGLQNKTILLVDDVITTGATIEACYIALQTCSNIKVNVLSLAYAKKE